MVDQLAEVLFIDPMEGYIGRILCALSKLGVIPAEAANDPWGPALTPHEVENISKRTQCSERASWIMFSLSADIQKSTPAIARRWFAITNVFELVCLKIWKTMFVSNIRVDLCSCLRRSRDQEPFRQSVRSTLAESLAGTPRL